ncbi:MAG: HAD-IA family hydrolase [Planctomycetota bacterium]|nr:HAD-IA family hydrolase [Planctomycetota bacterium]
MALSEQVAYCGSCLISVFFPHEINPIDVSRRDLRHGRRALRQRAVLICEAACRMFQNLYHTAVQPADFVPFVGAGENRYIGGVAEKHGLAIDITAAKRRTYAIYLEIIRGRLTPLPGAREFIAACRRGGLALAVATSADRVKLTGNLAQIGIAPAAFDVCLTGDDVEKKKPHPEIFLTAAARLNLPPGACLVVEDAPNGIRAGQAAGCPCLGLTTSFAAADLQAAGADWLAADLAAVPAELLAQLLPA